MLNITTEYIEEKNKILKINIKGYIDSSNASGFEKKIMDIINKGEKYLIFNCQYLTFVSSAGMGVFTLINKQLKLINGYMVIYNLIEEILNVFRLLGFIRFFNITITEEEAIKKINEIIKSSVQNSNFPKIIECPKCKQKLRVNSAGKYRCVKCGNIIEVS